MYRVEHPARNHSTTERPMTENRSRKMFVSLPVRDLKQSMDFFGKLGFSFNPQFTDEKAACMIIGEDAYVMLLTEAFFRTFTRKELCDTSKYSEGLFARLLHDRAKRPSEYLLVSHS